MHVICLPFFEIITKMYHLSLEAGAPGKSVSVISCTLVETGKQHLDCAGAVGLGSRPLVFTLYLRHEFDVVDEGAIAIS